MDFIGMHYMQLKTLDLAFILALLCGVFMGNAICDIGVDVAGPENVHRPVSKLKFMPQVEHQDVPPKAEHSPPTFQSPPEPRMNKVASWVSGLAKNAMNTASNAVSAVMNSPNEQHENEEAAVQSGSDTVSARINSPSEQHKPEESESIKLATKMLNLMLKPIEEHYQNHLKNLPGLKLRTKIQKFSKVISDRLKEAITFSVKMIKIPIKDIMKSRDPKNLKKIEENMRKIEEIAIGLKEPNFNAELIAQMESHLKGNFRGRNLGATDAEEIIVKAAALAVALKDLEFELNRATNEVNMHTSLKPQQMDKADIQRGGKLLDEILARSKAKSSHREALIALAKAMESNHISEAGIDEFLRGLCHIDVEEKEEKLGVQNGHTLHKCT